MKARRAAEQQLNKAMANWFTLADPVKLESAIHVARSAGVDARTLAHANAKLHEALTHPQKELERERQRATVRRVIGIDIDVTRRTTAAADARNANVLVLRDPGGVDRVRIAVNHGADTAPRTKDMR